MRKSTLRLMCIKFGKICGEMKNLFDTEADSKKWKKSSTKNTKLTQRAQRDYLVSSCV